jgi:hypothetical protein
MVCTDDINLLQDNVNTTKKNTEALIDATKEVGLELNAENKIYVNVMSPECEENHNVKTADRYFENLAQFKFLGMTVTNQNLIHEVVKSMLNSGSVCYHSIQNFLSSV